MKVINLKILSALLVGLTSIASVVVVPVSLTPSLSNLGGGEVQNPDIPTDIEMYDEKNKIYFNGEGKILRYDGNTTTLEIPEYLESPEYGQIQVKKIAANAFYNSQFTKLTLPNSITEIGDNAFFSSRLTELTLPSSLIRIGAGAFISCVELTSLIIPDSVTEIGDSAFLRSPLNKLTLSNSLVKIGTKAFFLSKLTELVIPDSVTEIGDIAFFDILDTEVQLPTNCKYYSNTFPKTCSIKGGTKLTF